MTVPGTNGNGPSAAGSITRTPSFTPITPVVKERVSDVATRLSEVEKIIDDINLASAASTARSPTIGELHEEIGLLKKDINETRAAQKVQIDALRYNVKKDVKDHITQTMRVEIEKRIKGSIEVQVKAVVKDWGAAEDTKTFVGNLEAVLLENDGLLQDARIKLHNSRSRHQNSTLDEHEDFEVNLAKIKLPDGSVGGAFPRTLKTLFSYDEDQIRQLFDEYGLQQLNTHLENLNRFLAFIGLRFSVPEQSLIFLDEPPEYTSPDILEPQNENPTETSTPNEAEERTEVMPGAQAPEQPPPEPATMKKNTMQAQVQEKHPDEEQTDPEREKRGVQRDRVEQRQEGTELSTFRQQRPGAAMGHWPQQPTPTFLPRSQPDHVVPTPPPSSSTSNPSGTRGMGGWLKSLADGF